MDQVRLIGAPRFELGIPCIFSARSLGELEAHAIQDPPRRALVERLQTIDKASKVPHEGAEAGGAAVEERIDLIGVMQDSGNGFAYFALVQAATVHQLVPNVFGGLMISWIVAGIGALNMTSKNF
jgi:hypothetical protein